MANLHLSHLLRTVPNTSLDIIQPTFWAFVYEVFVSRIKDVDLSDDILPLGHRCRIRGQKVSGHVRLGFEKYKSGPFWRHEKQNSIVHNEPNYDQINAKISANSYWRANPKAKGRPNF